MTSEQRDSAAAPPPLPAEATYTVRLSSGQQFGPAPMSMIVQWASERRIPNDALLYPEAGGEPRSVFAFEQLSRVLGAPPTVGGPLSVPEEADTTTSKVIPYRNPPALVAYYFAVFSLLAGPVLGIPAVILGIMGLRKRMKNPSVHGAAHAWIGIIGGAIISTGYAVLFILIVRRN